MFTVKCITLAVLKLNTVWNTFVLGNIMYIDSLVSFVDRQLELILWDSICVRNAIFFFFFASVFSMLQTWVPLGNWTASRYGTATLKANHLMVLTIILYFNEATISHLFKILLLHVFISVNLFFLLSTPFAYWLFTNTCDHCQTMLLWKCMS